MNREEKEAYVDEILKFSSRGGGISKQCGDLRNLVITVNTLNAIGPLDYDSPVVRNLVVAY